MASTFLNTPGLPLGLRNNNPGNLRPLPGGQTWVGEISPDLVNNFSRFKDVAWGLRAMITDITGDIVLDGKNTIRKLVTAYAPPSENNTQAYINRVSQAMGVSPDAILQPTRDTLERLVRAKLNVELGAQGAAKISQSDLNEGFARLGNQALEWLKITITENPGKTLGFLVILGLIFWGFRK